MRKLFQADGNLTKLGRRTCTTLAGVYALAIVLLCFLPQTWYPQYKDFSTPGIIQIGRLYLCQLRLIVLSMETRWIVSETWLDYPYKMRLIFSSLSSRFSASFSSGGMAEP